VLGGRWRRAIAETPGHDASPWRSIVSGCLGTAVGAWSPPMPPTLRRLAQIMASALAACGASDALPAQPAVAPAESARTSANALAATAPVAASAPSAAATGDPERDFLAACDMRNTRPTEARVIFERVCKDGHGRSCTEFALMAARGAGDEPDDVASFRAASTACTARDQAEACAIAGVLILDRRAPEGAGDAKTYFDKGCSKRHYDSCQGQRYEAGRSEPAHNSTSRSQRPRFDQLPGTCPGSGGLHLGN